MRILSLLASFCLVAAAVATGAELVISTAVLSVSPEGGLLLKPSTTGIPSLKSGALWRIRIQTPSTPSSRGASRIISSRDQTARLNCRERDCRLEFESLRSAGEQLAIRLSIAIEAVHDEFRFTASIANEQQKWIVRDFEFPILDELEWPRSALLYWPAGMGVRLDPSLAGGGLSAQYPGNLSMQWFTLAGSGGGLYVGSEDPTLHPVQFAFRGGDSAGQASASLTRYPYATGQQTWTAPPVVLRPYQGAWRQAALRYRRFVDSWLKPASVPAWLRERTGWMLAILKQQNGDNMWRYDELDRIAAISSERGLNMLGLFGWAHGGHDSLYPDYIPDQAMGGAAVLKARLRELRSQGMPAILYANGQLIDTSTSFYRYSGNDAVCLQEDSTPYLQAIRKFHSATPVAFAQGDPLSPVWQERMLALARQAQALGAAGILYDQLGMVGQHPCFPREGEVRSPHDAWGPGRAAMLRRIADEMRKIDPEFAILTEGVVDANSDVIQFVHGSGRGFGPGPDSFPELFRFTMPEVIVTQRHGTPMLDRATANWACLYGMRHEIEMRYREDKEYLERGKVPGPDAYRDVTYYPPSAAMMRSTPPGEAAAYLRKLIAFEVEHSEFLMEGKFVDEDGLSIPNARLAGKVFASRGRRAVLLWNTSTEQVRPEFRLRGAACSLAFEPEAGRVSVEAPIPPQSVRLAVCDSVPVR